MLHPLPQISRDDHHEDASCSSSLGRIVASGYCCSTHCIQWTKMQRRHHLENHASICCHLFLNTLRHQQFHLDNFQRNYEARHWQMTTHLAEMRILLALNDL